MTTAQQPTPNTSMHTKLSSSIPVNMLSHVHNIPNSQMTSSAHPIVMGGDNNPNVNLPASASSGMVSVMKQQHQPIEIHNEMLGQIENVGPDDFDDSEGEEGVGRDKRSGRRKIRIEYIEDKSRRHITFSKRKAGIMKKAYELSTLTGTQVLLLVASETGHVYTFATPKLQPLITKSEGKNLIQACLNAPDQLSDLSIGLNESSHGYSHHREQLSAFPPEMAQMGMPQGQSDGSQYHRGSEELKAANAYAASMPPYATAQYMAAANANASNNQYQNAQNVAAYLNQVPQYHHPSSGMPYATTGSHHSIPNSAYMHPGYWASTSSPGPQIIGTSGNPNGSRSSLTSGSGTNTSNSSINMMGSGSTGNLQQHLASGTST